MLPGSELIGIGVDIISWDRIERFLACHSFEFVKRLLKPSEQAAFLNAHAPARFFARCFVAKEAYFKARAGKWMGEAGFRGIETLMEDEDQFRIISNDSRTEGRFFETSEGITAEVFVWKETNL